MRRAGIGSLTVALLLVSKAALAFHTGATFDKSAGAGGGGGIYYTGLAREHRWTCSACHENAPGVMKVRLAVVPAELFTTFKYQPGTTYAFTATMENESVGRQSARANYNSIALSVADRKGFPAGDFTGYAAEDFFAGPATIVSAGQKPGLTSWTFSWVAPASGAGPVTLHLASVDGNAAGQSSDSTLTDAFGDDVFVAKVELGELGGSAAIERAPMKTMLARDSHVVPARSSPALSLSAFAFALLFIPLARRSWRKHS